MSFVPRTSIDLSIAARVATNNPLEGWPELSECGKYARTDQMVKGRLLTSSRDRSI